MYSESDVEELIEHACRMHCVAVCCSVCCTAILCVAVCCNQFEDSEFHEFPTVSFREF